MPALKYSNRFKKDLKHYKNDRKALAEVVKVLDLLTRGRRLPAGYRDHRLFGEFSDCRECHILPDLPLIYKIEHEQALIL
jgi:mRNA interferase YafQ